MKPGDFIRVMVAMKWLGGRPAVRDYLAMRERDYLRAKSLEREQANQEAA